MYSTTLNQPSVSGTCPYYTAPFLNLSMWRVTIVIVMKYSGKKVYCEVCEADNEIIVVQLCHIVVYTKGGTCFSW